MLDRSSGCMSNLSGYVHNTLGGGGPATILIWTGGGGTPCWISRGILCRLQPTDTSKNVHHPRRYFPGCIADLCRCHIFSSPITYRSIATLVSRILLFHSHHRRLTMMTASYSVGWTSHRRTYSLSSCLWKTSASDRQQHATPSRHRERPPRTRNLRHPLIPVLAEGLSLRRQLPRVIHAPADDVCKVARNPLPSAARYRQHTIRNHIPLAHQSLFSTPAPKSLEAHVWPSASGARFGRSIYWTVYWFERAWVRIPHMSCTPPLLPRFYGNLVAHLLCGWSRDLVRPAEEDVAPRYVRTAKCHHALHGRRGRGRMKINLPQTLESHSLMSRRTRDAIAWSRCRSCARRAWRR